MRTHMQDGEESDVYTAVVMVMSYWVDFSRGTSTQDLD